MSAQKKAFVTVSLLTLFVLIWTGALFFLGADTIVAHLGVRNGYLLAFVVAILGGVSAFTSFSYYTAIITLAIGGLNPLVLGLIAGSGAMIGDMIFYYLGLQGRSLIPSVWEARLNRFTQWLERKPSWFTPVAMFIYIAFTPLPHDALMIAAAFAKIRYRTVIIVDLIGNIVLATWVAAAAGYGMNLMFF